MKDNKDSYIHLRTTKSDKALLKDAVKKLKYKNVSEFLIHTAKEKILNKLGGMKLNIKVVNKKLLEYGVPTYSTPGSAGLDLRVFLQGVGRYILPPNETVTLGTGIAIQIGDPGLVGIVTPRSGLGSKDGIILGNTVGVIDSDYQGEILVNLWNRSDLPYVIEDGQRVAQMLITPVEQVHLDIVDKFDNVSERGDKGLGSTGL